jgi:hypothetical protein
MKKSSCKGSDDKISCQSKRTKSEDKGSALGGEQPDGAVVNLEAMKGLLRKKGAGAVKPKGSKKKDKKTATFANSKQGSFAEAGARSEIQQVCSSICDQS